MAPKRKRSAPPPPPAADSSSSDDDSSSDEEQQAAAQPTPSLAKTSKSDSNSGSGSDSDHDPQTQTQTQNAPKKPPESSDSSDEEEEEEGDKEEVVPSESKKSSSSVAQRIWSEADEIALLGALSQYLDKIGKLPSKKEYASSFLSALSGLIGFPASEKQVYGKVRHMKQAYFQKRNKGSAAKFSNSHERTVFEMSETIFAESSKKGVKKKEAKKWALVEAGGDVANRGSAVRSEPSYLNLRSLIKEIIGEHKFSWPLPSVEDVVARIGESEARDFDSKAKILGTDALKLSVRKDNLKAELLSIIANDMADD